MHCIVWWFFVFFLYDRTNYILRAFSLSCVSRCLSIFHPALALSPRTAISSCGNTLRPCMMAQNTNPLFPLLSSPILSYPLFPPFSVRCGRRRQSLLEESKFKPRKLKKNKKSELVDAISAMEAAYPADANPLGDPALSGQWSVVYSSSSKVPGWLYMYPQRHDNTFFFI